MIHTLNHMSMLLEMQFGFITFTLHVGLPEQLRNILAELCMK